MPKEPSTKRRPSTNTKSDEGKSEGKRKRRYKCHPLEAFVKVDEVPINMHPSPLSIINYEHEDHHKQASRMEMKLVNFLWDFNSPCNGQARCRLPVEQYSPWINRTGDTEINRHIIYEFEYPNFPSFGDGEWAKNYMTVNQKNVGDNLRKRFQVDLSEDFDNIPYRCIVSKLVISSDTRLELYYAYLCHWVQVKDGKYWIESF
ncbi:hypothetical protein FDP41_006765 [Naegleria fowleri]|uniref:Uncharacterized protein n=1 Tax=Naegleria fowleri TaxID=5763 RepID=A0A6A5BKJ9_NAEFO|nr:uncharacterized protein FDP41_006765 [Naegleria fowleri]KAF0974155.1 hypothetical protein FDP41_006765 [Naegleria fowleri]